MIDSKHSDVKPGTVSPAPGQTPFPLRTSHGRKYFRIDLSSPVRFRLLRCKNGRLKLLRDRLCGEILNLSEGGVLLLTGSAVPEEGFILLTLSLNKLVVLEGVLGKIKRVERSEQQDFLVGVEFASIEQLEELASSEQVARLPVKVACFDRKLREIISSYLGAAELAT
ncbi:MAG: hypothetical protein GTO24_18290 [candidate division Zixibacteria bacterium]|nr:hypothetical protein [candidate division Zixibacteria bacterium]